MAQAGRNELGQWVSDDDTSVQVMRTLAEVCTQLVIDVSKRFILTDDETAFYVDKMFFVREALGMIDVGTKPKGDDDDSPDTG